MLGHLFTTCSDSVKVVKDSPVQIFGENWTHSVNSVNLSLELVVIEITDDLAVSHLKGIEEINREVDLRKQDIQKIERETADLKLKIREDFLDTRNHDADAKELLALVMAQGRHMHHIKALNSTKGVCAKVSKYTKKHVSTINANTVTQWVYKSGMKTVIWVPIHEQTYSISLEEDESVSYHVILPVVDLKPSLVRAQIHQTSVVYQSDLQNNSGCISDDTHLYVCDDRNHRIVAYGLETREVSWISGSYGDLDGQFQFLGGISFDANHLYICDWRNGRLQTFDKTTGKFVRHIHPALMCHYGPKDVVYDGGLLFILFSFVGRIQVREVSSGNVILEWGVKGSGPGELMNPLGIAVDREHVYVSDTNTHRIQVYDRRNGNFLFMWGQFGGLEGDLKSPKGISVWAGMVLVADCENNRVQCFSTRGEFLCVLSLWTQLYQPYMVHIDSKHIFVSDTGNSRVVRVDNVYGELMRKLQDCTLSSNYNFAEPKYCGSDAVYSLDL